MQTLETTDPKWKDNGELSAVDRFFLERIRDERDLIFLAMVFVTHVLILKISIFISD